MMFLLDTNVVSDAQKRVPEPSAWLARADSMQLYLSVVTLGEIERGITRTEAQNPLKAERLAQWLLELRSHHSKRILPVTEEIALTWGRLSAARTRSVPDTLIAATAMVHGLAVVTRNIRDFQDVGISVIDPWTG